MSGANTPKVLEIIRTAAADCTDSMARNELLDAAGIVRDLLSALKGVDESAPSDIGTADDGAVLIALTHDEVRDLRAAIAKATGAAS